MNWKYFANNWKTCAMGIGILIVWLLKEFCGVTISTEVASAITGILTFLGLMFAKDAKKEV